MLRQEGFGGRVTVVSADDAPPYDRPNLSKDYLAGTAPEEWIPLHPPDLYRERDRCASQRQARRSALTSWLLAAGAEPIRLQQPGAQLPHVRTLRSLADNRELIGRARKGSRAVVVGASFIGLETAAALRHREVEVHVLAPEAWPMERMLRPALGDFVRSLA